MIGASPTFSRPCACCSHMPILHLFGVCSLPDCGCPVYVNPAAADLAARVPRHTAQGQLLPEALRNKIIQLLRQLRSKPCSMCGAESGADCVDDDGRPVLGTSAHTERVEAVGLGGVTA